MIDIKPDQLNLLLMRTRQFARAIVKTGIQFNDCAYDCIHCDIQGDTEEIKHEEGCIYVIAKKWLEEKK